MDGVVKGLLFRIGRFGGNELMRAMMFLLFGVGCDDVVSTVANLRNSPQKKNSYRMQFTVSLTE
jgi:hypothetical protein